MNWLNNRIKEMAFTAVVVSACFIGIIVATGIVAMHENYCKATLQDMGYKPVIHGMTCYVAINNYWQRCTQALFFTIPVIK